MPRDALLVKRNVFVLGGGILAFHALVATLYATWYRVPADGCQQGELLVGTCQSAAVILLLPLLIGIGLVIFGALRFKAKPDHLEGHLHYGTGTHFLMGLLASIMAVSAFGYVYVVLAERALAVDQHVAITIGTTSYQLGFVLQFTLLVALFAFLPMLGMYLTQRHMRQTFLLAASSLADDDGEEFYGDADDELAPLPDDEPGEGRAGSMASKDVGDFDTEASSARRLGGGLVAGEAEEELETPDRWREAFGEEKAQPRKLGKMPYMPLDTKPVPAMGGAPFGSEEKKPAAPDREAKPRTPAPAPDFNWSQNSPSAEAPAAPPRAPAKPKPRKTVEIEAPDEEIMETEPYDPDEEVY